MSKTKKDNYGSAEVEKHGKIPLELTSNFSVLGVLVVSLGNSLMLDIFCVLCGEKEEEDEKKGWAWFRKEESTGDYLLAR